MNRISRRKLGIASGKTPPPVMPRSASSSGGLKKPGPEVKEREKGKEKERRAKKLPVETPVQRRPPAKEEGLSSQKLPSFWGKFEEGKSRFPAITKMQEKLLKRLSRRSKEAPELRVRPSNQYWSSTPRVKYYDGSTGPSSLSRSSSMRHGPPKTVSAQFQSSLLSLVERLEKTNPFFVRCIKSNGEKVLATLSLFLFFPPLLSLPLPPSLPLSLFQGHG